MLRSTAEPMIRWWIGLWFAGLGAVLAVMAHGFRWL
jgi:hypothetical protein